jgi:hypothetical protein
MNELTTVLADATPMDFHWLEQMSWASTVVMTVVAIFALKQVYAAIGQAKSALKQNQLALEQIKLTAAQLEVSRADIVLRSRREAIAAALEQCKRYAESIVPHFDAIHKEMTAKKYPFPKSVDPQFPFISEAEDPLGAQIWATDVALRVKIIQTLNELESFAMYFANDLADESVAFTPTGLGFCQICEYYRLFIGVYRQPDKVKLYQNLVKLYGIWKPRLERTVLEEQGRSLEAKMQKLPADKKGSPLGTVL